MTRVAVIGAGSWGTALADLLARQGTSTVLWAYEPEVVESVNARHENELYFTGNHLDPRLTATGDLAAAHRRAPT